MNYEILLIQNDIDEIKILPNIEDLYDMEKDSLVKVKKILDKNFPKLFENCELDRKKKSKNIINQNNEKNNFTNIDLDLEDDSICNNSEEFNHNFKINEMGDDNELDLPRLYSFLLSEIKQRELQEETVSFFLNEDSLFKLTENNFGGVYMINEEETKQSQINFDEVINKIDGKNKISKNEKMSVFDFDPTECSLKNIKEKLYSKSSKLAIKQMLLKNRENKDNFYKGIPQSSTNSQISTNIYSANGTQITATDSKPDSSIKYERNQMDKKNFTNEINNKTKNFEFIDKQTDYFDSSKIKKKKRKKKGIINEKEKEDDGLTTLERRKKFTVPEIKNFIKRENSESININKEKFKYDKMIENNRNNKSISTSKIHQNSTKKFEKSKDIKKIELKQSSTDLQKNIGSQNEKYNSQYTNLENSKKFVSNLRKSFENNSRHISGQHISRSHDNKLENYSLFNIKGSKIRKDFNNMYMVFKTVFLKNSITSEMELYDLLHHKENRKFFKEIKGRKIENSNNIDSNKLIIIQHQMKNIFKDRNNSQLKEMNILSKSDEYIKIKENDKYYKEKNNIKELNKERNLENVNQKNVDINLSERFNVKNNINESINTQLISQIKEDTDLLLLKYDISKRQDLQEQGYESNEEDEGCENCMDEEGEYSKYLKLDYIHNKDANPETNILSNNNLMNKKLSNNNIEISDNDKKDSKFNINKKKTSKINFFTSSGHKNYYEQIEEIKKNPDVYINLEEDNSKFKNEFHNLKTNHNGNKLPIINVKNELLFYETSQNQFSSHIKNNIEIDEKKNPNLENKRNLKKTETEKIKAPYLDLNLRKISKKQNDEEKSIRNKASNERLNINSNQINLESTKNKDKKNSTANQFNNKLNKTGSLQLTTYKDSRAYSGKNPLFNLQKQKIIISNAIPDYTKYFSNFNEILNGYFIPSDSKGFDPEAALRNLYEQFKNLYIFETKESNSNQKFNIINKNVVEAEAQIIKNRIRKVSEFLLNDQNYLSEERYYIFKKIQELQKKEFNGEKLDEVKIDNEENDSNNMSSKIEFFRNNKIFFRVVLSRPEIYDIVCYTLGLKNQWRELPHGMLLGQSWNLLWTYSSPGINFHQLFTWQKVNHFINNRQISRKDLLKKSIDRIKKFNPKLNNSFDIMPKTFILAKDYLDFVDDFTRNKTNPNNIWIVKPVGKSRGRGIFLINDLCDVPMVDSFLVQKYLTNPFLIDGYKFDMRIYVLLTSVNPLEAFLYKDGFARVSNQKFSISSGTIGNKLVHLTNAAIQNKHTQKGQSYEKIFGGSKISLELLKQKMGKFGVEFDKQIWPQVKTIILKSLVACQYEMPYCPSAFELFGYDIIIDSDLKCWLLEVNSSPSLDRTSVLDDAVKLELVDDILNLLNPINFDRNALIEVLERRLNINKSSSSINKTGSSGIYLYSPSVQLNLDLNSIFKGEMPRAFGENPKKVGQFEMIAPTDESNHLIKITGGEKKFNNKKS